MTRMPLLRPSLLAISLAASAIVSSSLVYCSAQAITAEDVSSYTGSYGPYSGSFIAGGPGLAKPVPTHDTILKAGATWTMSAWVYAAEPVSGPVLLAGIGDPVEEDSRLFRGDGWKAGVPAGRRQCAQDEYSAGSEAVAFRP